jgi:hypothetical protein
MARGHGSKEARSETAEMWFAAGKFYFLNGAPWTTDLQTELLQFPNGTFMDQVDVVSHCCIMVQQQNGLPPAPPEGDEAEGELVPQEPTGGAAPLIPMVAYAPPASGQMEVLSGRYRRQF